jgi:hypothetical protein
VDGEFWDVDLASLPERVVERARLLVATKHQGIGVAAVLDADGGRWVRVPDLPSPVGAHDSVPLALSPDGRHLLLLAARRRVLDGLCLHELATGRQRWYDAHAGPGQDWLASVSPDGARIATLTVAGRDFDATVSVHLIDIADGARRLLWSSPGSWSNESAVGWSPDGSLIAATHLTKGEEWACAVIDTATGTVLALDEQTVSLPSPNGTWTPEGHLVTLREDELVEIAVTAFRPAYKRTVCGPGDAIPLAIMDGRLIHHDRRPITKAAEPVRDLITTNLDGTDPRPFLTLRRTTSVRTIDTAPAADQPGEHTRP